MHFRPEQNYAKYGHLNVGYICRYIQVYKRAENWYHNVATIIPQVCVCVLKALLFVRGIIFNKMCAQNQHEYDHHKKNRRVLQFCAFYLLLFFQTFIYCVYIPTYYIYIQCIIIFVGITQINVCKYYLHLLCMCMQYLQQPFFMNILCTHGHMKVCVCVYGGVGGQEVYLDFCYILYIQRMYTEEK